MSTSLQGAYVRVAKKPHEYTEAAWILTRAFARDPCMNWFGSVKEMVPEWKNAPDYNTHPAAAKKALRNLFAFQHALVKATILCGGLITLAIIPKQQEGHAVANDPATKKDETIAGVTLWLRPGQPLDFPITIIVRSGIWKVLLKWGFSGVKRVLIEFSPAVEKSLTKGFKARNLDRLDSWHLLEMVIDPPYQGKGLCTLMMNDGFKLTTPKPVHLEATTARSRDIYSRFGFEVDEEHCFGKGTVDSKGLVTANKKKATGYPEWIMTKWTY